MDLLRSLPIGLYLEQPISWLHRIDPRVKAAWLMAFLLTPIAASPLWRLSLVGWLLLLMVSTFIPFRIWRKQTGLVALFSLLLFCVTLLAPDGLNVRHQPRTPDTFPLVQPAASATPPATSPTPAPRLTELPQPTGYEYILFQRGVFRVTRRSLDLAIRVGTLAFTLLVSTNLFLLTTAPEEITAAIDDLMQPLRRLNVPVTEIVLTLTLSLRFIPLVLEEVQNLVRSVRTRAISWKKLGFRGSTQVWVMISERLVDNLLVRAEQIASAMQVRGFTSPNQHRVRWHQLRLRAIDWMVLLGLGLLCFARFAWGGMD